MRINSVQELIDHLAGAVEVHDDAVRVVDESAVPGKIDELAYTSVFGEGLTRDTARWLIMAIGQALDIFPASIHELYMAIGRGDVAPTFTVPAMNIRAMNYNSSRAVFRAANQTDVGAMIFEIARSEMGYTDQRPSEYTAAVIAAAIKEGFRGPVFIQGDHFQISASRFAKDPDGEVQAVKDLIVEAVAANFYNIDIDTSTLVDLSFETLDEQQRLNYSLCADLTRFVREIEPDDVTVSLGGEIGEVGHKNSTVEELHAFMQGYNRSLGDATGISKISVQTGTSHGGVVLPDGTLAQVSVDFDTLHELGVAAREDYGLGGAVQHGASTLPPNAFSKFPEVGTVEIHLATNFQNIVFDNLPDSALATAYDYVRNNHKDEWKEGKTEEQFLYSSRKRAIGRFKKAWWDMDPVQQSKVGNILQAQFEFLFEQLNVGETRGLVSAITSRPAGSVARPRAASTGTVVTEDVRDLAD